MQNGGESVIHGVTRSQPNRQAASERSGWQGSSPKTGGKKILYIYKLKKNLIINNNYNNNFGSKNYDFLYMLKYFLILKQYG